MAERPADRRTYDFGIMMRASATIRTNSIGAIGAAFGERRAGDRNQHVDRNAFRRLGEVRKRDQHFDAVGFFLAHAEDAAATHFHAGLPDILQRVETIGKIARRGHLRVIARRRIDIVVVVIEPRRAEAVRLIAVQHSQRHAGLEPERFHRANHFDDGIHVSRLRIAPCRAHAVARCAAVSRFPCFGDDLFDVHQLRGGKPRRMMRGLAAIAAIFRAAAGLDIEQLAELHAVGIEMPAVNGLRLEQEIVERQPVERPGRLARPLRASASGAVTACSSRTSSILQFSRS